MEEIAYSDEFQQMIRDMHAGSENSPFYDSYIIAHLGAEKSRLMEFWRSVIPEIEHHCGPLEGKRVLDFGCGTGASTAALAERSGAVIGFDVWEASVRIARQRLLEHGLCDRARFVSGRDVDEVSSSMGTFDLVVALGVIEHLPISKRGLRQRVLSSVARLIKPGGFLFLGDTPNRLWPEDSHTTRLWWIPWSRPGSSWALDRAVSKGRYSVTEHYAAGPLGLEEQGAWGATYWEICRYLRGCGMSCVNMTEGHNRHLCYVGARSRKEAAFEAVMRSTACRIFRAPITAFAPYLNNLVFRKA